MNVQRHLMVLPRLLFIVLLVTHFCVLGAEEFPSVGEVLSWPRSEGASRVLLEDGFDHPGLLSGVRLGSGWRLESGMGLNGTGALVYDLGEGVAPVICSLPIPGVSSGILYQVEVFVRTDELVGEGDFGGVCVEFYRSGKWFGGVYPRHQVQSGVGGWRLLSFQFALKPGSTGAKVSLYLRSPFRGRLYVDDLRVRSAGDSSAAIVPVRPFALTFWNGSGRYAFHGSMQGVDDPALLVSATLPGGELRRQLLRPSKGLYVGDLGHVPEGAVSLSLRLVDVSRRQIVLESEFAYRSRYGNRLANSCHLDESGRLIRSGRPFLPIGIFSTQEPESLRRVSAAGFNTVVIYGSTGLSTAGVRGTRLETIRAAMDVIHGEKLGLIFSLKDQYDGKTHACAQVDQVRGIASVTAYLVENLKSHPALLGWYLSDEDVRGAVPQLLAMRQRVSALDPDHPTLTLSFRPDDFPYYGISGDVSCFDDYPVRPHQAVHMGNIAKGMDAIVQSGGTAWVVPQIFNWGTYRARNQADYDRNYRFPTLDELRAMTLLPAIQGAKGFIFYSDFDLWKRAATYDPESSPVQWKKVCQVVSMLHELEPFLLSSHARVPLVPVWGDGAPVRAAHFRDDAGHERVLIASLGPGASRASFQLSGHWTSTYGKMRQENGLWQYAAGGMDSEILVKQGK